MSELKPYAAVVLVLFSASALACQMSVQTLASDGSDMICIHPTDDEREYLNKHPRYERCGEMDGGEACWCREGE